jgi:hypothetical protein
MPLKNNIVCTAQIRKQREVLSANGCRHSGHEQVLHAHQVNVAWSSLFTARPVGVPGAV